MRERERERERPGSGKLVVCLWSVEKMNTKVSPQTEYKAVERHNLLPTFLIYLGPKNNNKKYTFLV